MMLARLITFLVILPMIVHSLRCYNYTWSSKVNPVAVEQTLETCAPSQLFCTRAYRITGYLNGERAWAESHSCADQQECQASGCTVSQVDEHCCCSDDFCNTSTILFEKLYKLRFPDG